MELPTLLLFRGAGVIERITEITAPELYPAHRAVWLCHQLGIRHQSHSYHDYERAKSYLQSWNLEPGDYDVALKSIVDYVQI